MNTLDLVNAALSGDKDSFQAAFNDVISTKVSDALDVKKVEVASTLITPEVGTDEVQEIEAEVDGSAAAEDAVSATEEV